MSAASGGQYPLTLLPLNPPNFNLPSLTPNSLTLPLNLNNTLPHPTPQRLEVRRLQVTTPTTLPAVAVSGFPRTTSYYKSPQKATTLASSRSPTPPTTTTPKNPSLGNRQALLPLTNQQNPPQNEKPGSRTCKTCPLSYSPSSASGFTFTPTP